MDKTDHLMAEKNKNNKDSQKGQVTRKNIFLITNGNLLLIFESLKRIRKLIVLNEYHTDALNYKPRFFEGEVNKCTLGGFKFN